MDISNGDVIVLSVGIIFSLGMYYLLRKDIYNDWYPSIEYLKEKQEERLKRQKQHENWLKDIHDSFEYEQLKKEKQIQWEKACIESNTILPK